MILEIEGFRAVISNPKQRTEGLKNRGIRKIERRNRGVRKNLEIRKKMSRDKSNENEGK